MFHLYVHKKEKTKLKELTRRVSSKIWMPSSRVGRMINANGEALVFRAPGRGATGGFFCIFVRILDRTGSRNAAVFPDPVCAHAKRSKFFIKIGIAFLYFFVFRFVV